MAKIASSRYSETAIAARMDRLPVTPLHRRAVVVIGLGQFFDLYEIFLAGVLSSVLASQFKLEKGVVALLLASAFIGMFVGAIALGRLADRLGRRRAFLLSLGIYSTFSLLSAFSPGPAMLVVTRFFAGVGIGAEPPIADSYLSDLLPPRNRGRYIAWAYTIGFLGVPASGFLARGLAPIAPLGIEGWRWMFVIGALGSVVVAFLRRSLRSRRAGSPRTDGARKPMRSCAGSRPTCHRPSCPSPTRCTPRRCATAGRSASCWCRRSASAPR